MDAALGPAPDRPDPELVRPGQARRRSGRGGQQAPGTVPRLPEARRRDVGRQLPRPGPRCTGRGHVDVRPVPTRRDAELQGTNDPAPPPADTLPPGLADHPDYEIKRELGRGGMGVVYLAHNTLMGRDEVLKVMGRQIMERPGVLDRFLREIRAVAKLRHPNIVTAYSAVRLGESIVFAMEYVDGLDLSKMVKAKGPLPVGPRLQLRLPGGPRAPARPRGRARPPRHQARAT